MQYIDADAVVIGGGIAGSFTALRLAQKGLSVRLLEQGPLFREASGRNGGGVRQQFRNPAEIPLAMESVKIWAGLAEELGSNLEYRRQGSLRLLRSQEELDFARMRVKREHALGLEVDLLTPDQVRDRVPSLSPEMKLLGGTLCPSDGTANPLLMGQALEPALKRAGVHLHLHEPVEGLTVENGRALATRTKQGRYRADSFVIAAGPWSLGMCRGLGLDYPVAIRKTQLLITEAVSPVITGFISFDEGYLRQALDGNLHLGVRGEPLQAFDKELTFGALVHAGLHFPQVFPFIRKLQVIRGFTGITTWPPDGIPIIDRAPGIDGLYLATGFSGHGFCMGPIVGRLLTEWITDGRPSMDLADFAWNRFETTAKQAV